MCHHMQEDVQIIRQIGSNFTFHDFNFKYLNFKNLIPNLQSKIREEEKPSNPNEKLEAVINQKNNQKSGIKEPKLSAAALKNKKKREAKKGQASGGDQEPPKPEIKPESGGNAPPSDVEKEMRKLKKKLDAVEKLKKKLQEGEVLEKNQLDKIKTEKDILNQMEQLQLS